MPLCNKKPHREIKYPDHMLTSKHDVSCAWFVEKDTCNHAQLDECHLESEREDAVGGCDQVCFAVI